MSTPVVTDKWAGSFDCHVCRRKRLMADEFSKKALERYRKEGGSLKCKQCVAAHEAAERQVAAERRESSCETRVCASCQQDLDASQYNRNQWSKGEGKSKCRSCVEQALKEEEAQRASSKQTKLQEAREEVDKAKVSGDSQAILKAESILAALEAESVTGLKPVRMSGRGGGRNSGRFRSSGRGGRGR